MTVAELLTDETKWTQGRYARNSNGCYAEASGDEAVCWCLEGALYRCYGIPDDGSAFNAAYRRLRDAIGGEWVARWNDDPQRTFAEVRAAIEKAGI